MKKKTLVLGAGRVGGEAAKLLLDMGHDVTVIEKDQGAINDIEGTTATIIEGDASDTDILEQVNLEDTDDVLALTGDVEANLASCLIIDRMGHDLEKTLRVSSQKQKKNYESLVDNVVYPEASAARETVQEVDENFDILTSFGGEFKVSEVTVSEGSPVQGKRINKIGFPSDCLVIASEGSICDGDTRMEEGEKYLVVFKRSDVSDVKMLFNG